MREQTFVSIKTIPKTYNSIYKKLLTLNTWSNPVDLKQHYSSARNKFYHRNTKASRTTQEDSEEPGISLTLLSKSLLFILILSSSVLTGIANTSSAYVNFFFAVKFTQRRNREKPIKTFANFIKSSNYCDSS